eukprot:scaffold26919_cov101-Isochrysis_galbana.AAC.2
MPPSPRPSSQRLLKRGGAGPVPDRRRGHAPNLPGKAPSREPGDPAAARLQYCADAIAPVKKGSVVRFAPSGNPDNAPHAGQVELEGQGVVRDPVYQVVLGAESAPPFRLVRHPALPLRARAQPAPAVVFPHAECHHIRDAPVGSDPRRGDRHHRLAPRTEPLLARLLLTQQRVRRGPAPAAGRRRRHADERVEARLEEPCVKRVIVLDREEAALQRAQGGQVGCFQVAEDNLSHRQILSTVLLHQPSLHIDVLVAFAAATRAAARGSPARSWPRHAEAGGGGEWGLFPERSAMRALPRPVQEETLPVDEDDDRTTVPKGAPVARQLILSRYSAEVRTPICQSTTSSFTLSLIFGQRLFPPHTKSASLSDGATAPVGGGRAFREPAPPQRGGPRDSTWSPAREACERTSSAESAGGESDRIGGQSWGLVAAAGAANAARDGGNSEPVARNERAKARPRPTPKVGSGLLARHKATPPETEGQIDNR